MARLTSVLGVLKAVARASWRDFRSFQSIAGQNLFLFLIFVALQPESAEFFFVILALVLLVPLSADPMQKIPADRRLTWPLLKWEWAVIRLASLGLSPIAWIAALLILTRADSSTNVLFVGTAIALQPITYLVKRTFVKVPKTNALHWIPAPPGITGGIMRLQWREMLRTLDPYIALVLVACIELYRTSGKPLDPTAPRIMALVIVIAMSTQTQVLFGLDGSGVARYRQFPIRGWRILLAKDLAFLALLGLLVLPLDFVSGTIAGIAALTIGHHRSVFKTVPQAQWRFTSGMLFPDGVIQIAVIFGAGNNVREQGVWLPALCISAWLASLLFYGWQWDRSNQVD
ncbi:MAG TPA: hypothetical protein VGG97_03260 [Bryobacteraceae bacterium]